MLYGSIREDNCQKWISVEDREEEERGIIYAFQKETSAPSKAWKCNFPALSGDYNRQNGRTWVFMGALHFHSIMVNFWSGMNCRSMCLTSNVTLSFIDRIRIQLLRELKTRSGSREIWKPDPDKKTRSRSWSRHLRLENFSSILWWF